jgi:hypothetical protein
VHEERKAGYIRRGGTGAEGDYLHNLHAKANEPPETFRPFIPKAVISVPGKTSFLASRS